MSIKNKTNELADLKAINAKLRS